MNTFENLLLRGCAIYIARAKPISKSVGHTNKTLHIELGSVALHFMRAINLATLTAQLIHE